MNSNNTKEQFIQPKKFRISPEKGVKGFSKY
jgi:hypothetical protein